MVCFAHWGRKKKQQDHLTHLKRTEIVQLILLITLGSFPIQALNHLDF